MDLQKRRDLGVLYKTAFVLTHKARQSLLAQREETSLSSEVEVAGVYVCGPCPPGNGKEKRADRRLAENQNPDKRRVLVMREKHPEQEAAPVQ